MAAPKIKSQMQDAQVKTLIAKLSCRGYSQWQISDEVERQLGVKLHQTMISKKQAALRQELKDERLKERRDQVDQLLDQYNEELRECWRALDKSWEDEESLTEEFADCKEEVAPDDYVTSEQRVKRIVAKKGRLPASQWMGQIQAIHKAVRELLGLDEEVYQNLMKIEEAEQMFKLVLETQREMLADQPELLQAIQMRCIEKMNLPKPPQVAGPVEIPVEQSEATDADQERPGGD